MNSKSVCVDNRLDTAAIKLRQRQQISTTAKTTVLSENFTSIIETNIFIQ